MSHVVKSTQQLIDLVLNPEDPGYRAAAARRGADASPRWYDRPVVALGAAVIGFLLVVAYVHQHRNAPEAAKVHDELVKRVRTAQDTDQRLTKTAQQLSTQLGALGSRALPAADAAALQRSELLAGQVAVSGPGLQVTLSDAPAPSPSATAGRPGTVPIGQTASLTDRDVRGVVNELWADGAEAISVNDVRLTPTSAIRFAGQAVLVDYEPITSPYTIRAIGNPDGLATAFASSEVASRYNTLAGTNGIGFRFGESKRLSLPANAIATPRYARPATGGAR